MLTKKGKFLVDYKWYNGGGGEWEMHDLPEGSEIIGIKCNNSLKFSIPTLSFILWQRSNRHTLQENPLTISHSRLVRHTETKKKKIAKKNKA